MDKSLIVSDRSSSTGKGSKAPPPGKINSENEDPLLPFYAKAREEAGYVGHPHDFVCVLCLFIVQRSLMTIIDRLPLLMTHGVPN